jgi:ferritin-like metal-binding protein YciE
MEKSINTLQDALAYQLKGLFYSELKVRGEFEICSKQLESLEVKKEIQCYIGNADNVLQKLERVFNYLMQEPTPRKNEVTIKMIDETHHLLGLTSSQHLKDIITVSCIQNINAYKISAYKTAHLLAVELELDTAADLLQEILEWELATGRLLAALSIREFNKINNPVKTK